jgi:hypothetical protein
LKAKPISISYRGLQFGRNIDILIDAYDLIKLIAVAEQNRTSASFGRKFGE